MKRLVDADRLMEQIKMHCYLVKYDYGYTSVEYGMTLSGIAQCIKECEERQDGD